MRVAIINLQEMKVSSIYDADAPEQHKYGGDWGRIEVCVHVPIPDDVTGEFLNVEEDGQGGYTFTDNMEPERNAKLAMIRTIRKEVKFKELDIMINDLTVGDRTDTTAVRNYRQALKDVTNDHKYANDDKKGKSSLDAFAEDMSDFVWPLKP